MQNFRESEGVSKDDVRLEVPRLAWEQRDGDYLGQGERFERSVKNCRTTEVPPPRRLPGFIPLD